VTGRIQVEADLTLERGEDTFTVWTEGETVVVNAPSLSALRHADPLVTAVPTGVLDGRALPDRTPPIELRVRHATVGQVGPEVTPTPGVERLAGVPARVVPRGVLAAAIRALG
jgi:hypothetical protein